MMEPGRELDALIAEKVMLFQPKQFVSVKQFDFISDNFRALNDGTYEISSPIPFYSTDIAAAWTVAQTIQDMDEDHDFVIHLSNSKFQECTVEVRFWDDSDPKDPILAGPYYILGKTAPHAICLAALKAVGMEV